jgi:uncharacterized protein YcbX
MAIQLTKLNIYPVKSLGGISLTRASVTATGLEHDRRWLVTDPNGRFLTQRDHPRMATLKLSWVNGEIVVRFGGREMKLSAVEDEETRDVVIWDDSCAAVDLGETAAEWVSKALDTNARIVYMPDSARRAVNTSFGGSKGVVSFADAFPFLLIGETSLQELNSRIDIPLGMERFRPNLVVSGTEPFAEDGWRRLRVGRVEFNVVKPCARCVVTTIDQSLGRSGGKEPLKTLATFRRAEQVHPERFSEYGFGKNDVLFGQNLVARAAGGELNVGDDVEVLE